MSTTDRRNYCLIGDVVDGNPTGEMMEAAFASAGLNWRYISLPIPPDRFEDAMSAVRTLGFAGAHITKPYKIRAIGEVTELTPAAEAIGAVNCIVRHGAVLVGDNTDGRGLARAVQPVHDLDSSAVVVLGAGGAARAVAVELALCGASDITIVSRSADAGRSLVSAVNAASDTECRFEQWTGIQQVPANTDVVVNATSVGMLDPNEAVAVDLQLLGPAAVAADVVIAAEPTAFLLDAARHGLATVEGSEMLVKQAAISFELWASKAADEALLRQVLHGTLEHEPA